MLLYVMLRQIVLGENDAFQLGDSSYRIRRNLLYTMYYYTSNLVSVCYVVLYADYNNLTRGELNLRSKIVDGPHARLRALFGY